MSCWSLTTVELFARILLADAIRSFIEKNRLFLNSDLRRNSTSLDVLDWSKKAVSLGVGEILLTSMDSDGTKSGYDIELTNLVSSAVSVPIIASGGAGKLEHLSDALIKGKADAVLAASIFHFGEFTIGETKKFLIDQGINIRE